MIPIELRPFTSGMRDRPGSATARRLDKLLQISEPDYHPRHRSLSERRRTSSPSKKQEESPVRANRQASPLQRNRSSLSLSASRYQLEERRAHRRREEWSRELSARNEHTKKERDREIRVHLLAEKKRLDSVIQRGRSVAAALQGKRVQSAKDLDKVEVAKKDTLTDQEADQKRLDEAMRQLLEERENVRKYYALKLQQLDEEKERITLVFHQIGSELDQKQIDIKKAEESFEQVESALSLHRNHSDSDIVLDLHSIQGDDEIALNGSRSLPASHNCRAIVSTTQPLSGSLGNSAPDSRQPSPGRMTSGRAVGPSMVAMQVAQGPHIPCTPPKTPVQPTSGHPNVSSVSMAMPGVHGTPTAWTHGTHTPMVQVQTAMSPSMAMHAMPGGWRVGHSMPATPTIGIGALVPGTPATVPGTPRQSSVNVWNVRV